MDLDELQSVQSRERQTDSLQQLRATFYRDAAEFVHSLEAERDDAAERAEDPWNSPEVGRLNDDIDTAEGTVEAIYERRVGKIVKMASLAAADMPTEDGGLTDEERELFETLVTAIEENRRHVFAILDGEDPVDVFDGDDSAEGDSDTDEPDPADGTSQTDAADMMGATGETDPDGSGTGTVDESQSSGRPPADGRETEPDTAGSPDPVGGEADGGGESEGDDEDAVADQDSASTMEQVVDRTTVRITSDVGEIFGVDERAYDLNADDVVTLPAANAAPLVDSDAAERLE